MSTTEIKLSRRGGYRFEASNRLGKTAILDGPTKIGGNDDGMRPMEMVLVGLAGCSSFDVLHTLEKGRQKPEDVEVVVTAERADAVPAVFTKIAMHFKVSGAVTEKRLQQAIDLSVEKYCSVAAMLGKTAEISTSYEIVE
jgi:putative redox protein